MKNRVPAPGYASEFFGRLLWFKLLAVILTFSVIATACTQLNPQTLLTPKPALAGQLNDDAVHANNAFGIALFKQLLSEEGEVNRFISPYSITLALSMTYNGAGGETAAEMARALQLGELDRQTVTESHAALTHRLLRDDSGVTLSIANSLWGREGVAFGADFLAANENYYAAGLEQLDFSRPEAVDVINQWVADHTGGHIEEMLGGLHPNLILLLVNAIYFQGDWSAPFDPQLTYDAPFHNLDGTTSQVPMMWQRDDFAHLAADGIQAVRLPYGDPEDLAMYVFLPSAELGIEAFHEALTYEQLRAWLDAFQTGEIMLGLPRFELEYEAALNDALMALGMELAFSGAADFSAMLEGGGSLWIDEVQHKSYVKVDEEGTTAAAATSVGMITSAPSFMMTVDRPFFFMIHDAESDAILFMGSVVELGG